MTSGDVGIVIIGRNEGEQLTAAFASVAAVAGGVPVVYADSDSTDDSVARAEQAGVEIVRVDPAGGLSAARGRNLGLARLLDIAPAVRFVQFIDGDCTLEADWIDAGRAAMCERDDVAIVCGRLTERQPEASPWNRLCQVEWDAPAGEVRGCGGIFMARVSALEGIGGFAEDLVAGEEPEMCLRLRDAGGRIVRLEAPMATHDAAMTRFGQWWTRAARSGLAYAEAIRRHPRHPERPGRRESISAWVWSVGVAAVIAVATALVWPWGLLLAGLFPLQAMRIARRTAGRWGWGTGMLHGTMLMVAKWAQVWGQIRWAVARPWRRSARRAAA
ncbi:MAG: glycosyltransferase family 2 protein [Phycisphaerales bacterium]